ncbi:MAG: hypothetical protein HGA31_05305 [Candidatus Moranbacteria bacterium]|nr:hypothetical protein [Candidatus Moranbacteria bacterium]
MGQRDFKRVPMHFNWPIDRIWKGYLNPVCGPRECECCHGTGLNNGAARTEECKKCGGSGETRMPRKKKKAYRKWKEYDPPVGEGWQLWETCTEGSPQSPVFATPQQLAEWCAKNAFVFANEGATYEQWLRMILTDSADVNSLLVLRSDGYVGSIANAP